MDVMDSTRNLVTDMLFAGALDSLRKETAVDVMSYVSVTKRITWTKSIYDGGYWIFAIRNEGNKEYWNKNNIISKKNQRTIYQKRSIRKIIYYKHPDHPSLIAWIFALMQMEEALMGLLAHPSVCECFYSPAFEAIWAKPEEFWSRQNLHLVLAG